MKTLCSTLLAICLLLASPGFAQVQVFNSYPIAEATVFLDFDGQLVEGTSWNMNGPISCGPSGLTTAQITEVFNRVSEDYRPFNINITTDSMRYWAAPPNKRMRVILTVTSDWYGAAGGVSYVGSFSWGDNTPAFVFTALLHYNTKNISEAAAHEIGHTLGLRHQSSYDANCTKLSEYNSGSGSGEIGWAPIMGVGYYRNFTLWNNGANPYGCTNYQDDLAIITSSDNGFGYRPDDYANLADSSATTASFTANEFNMKGVIETNTDQDVFQFALPVPGHFHLDAIPYNQGNGDAGSNLDLKVELLNGAQAVVGTYNPDLLLSATIDTALDAGTYYLRVQGSGNAYAQEYASLGSYDLKGTFTPSNVLALHRLELHGASQNSRHQFDWIIDADEQVVQQVLESSANGTSFQPLASPPGTVRAYQYLPATNGMAYYRLKVNFDNGRQYYSNVVALRSSMDKKPALLGTMAGSALTASSPAGFSYTILDYSGRSLAKGKLAEGSNAIPTGFLSNGLYLVRYSNGQEQYTEKFMKQ